MQLNDYIDQVCPYCGSKRLVRVIFYRQELLDVSSEDCLHACCYHCENCKRVFEQYNTIYRLNKSQMRRDLEKLQKYLKRALPQWKKAINECVRTRISK